MQSCTNNSNSSVFPVASLAAKIDKHFLKMSLQLHLLLLQWLSHLGTWKKIMVVPFMITKQERNENTSLDFENNSWLTSSAVCTKTCKLWQGEKHERCCHLQLHLSGAWDQTVYVDSPSAPKKPPGGVSEEWVLCWAAGSVKRAPLQVTLNPFTGKEGMESSSQLPKKTLVTGEKVQTQDKLQNLFYSLHWWGGFRCSSAQTLTLMCQFDFHNP